MRAYKKTPIANPVGVTESQGILDGRKCKYYEVFGFGRVSTGSLTSRSIDSVSHFTQKIQHDQIVVLEGLHIDIWTCYQAETLLSSRRRVVGHFFGH